jgi:hypothetical protein
MSAILSFDMFDVSRRAQKWLLHVSSVQKSDRDTQPLMDGDAFDSFVKPFRAGNGKLRHAEA